jgi:prophage endopeptidase
VIALPSVIPIQVKVVVALALAVACVAVGWCANGWRKDAQISRLETTQAQATKTAAEQFAQRLQAAQSRGNALTAQLDQAQKDIDQLTQEKQDAIRRLTTGRPCLGSAAVRVLNNPAGLQPVGMPGAASQPAADDGSFATDTDVGLWIGTCERSFNTCRARLQAVADFFNNPPAKAGQ